MAKSSALTRPQENRPRPAKAPEALPDGSILVYRLNVKGHLQAYRFWPESGRLQELPLESPGQTGTFGFRMGRGIP